MKSCCQWVSNVVKFDTSIIHLYIYIYTCECANQHRLGTSSLSLSFWMPCPHSSPFLLRSAQNPSFQGRRKLPRARTLSPRPGGGRSGPMSWGVQMGQRPTLFGGKLRDCEIGVFFFKGFGFLPSSIFDVCSFCMRLVALICEVSILRINVC